MQQYKNMIRHVLENGTRRGDRTGTGTISVFGHQERYDLREGFPLVTLKKTMFKSLIKELLWFLRGETNTNTLGCKIWDEWADKDGELGPIYGAQWRQWQVPTAFDEEFRIDQISQLVEGLKTNPLSRRHIVTAWNPAEINFMALPPCHTMFQCYASEIPLAKRLEFVAPAIVPQVGKNSLEEYGELLTRVGAPKYYLDLQLYQRSADLGLGVPFNIASYSLLLMMLAREVGMVPRFFVHSFGDLHIYEDHVDALKGLLDLNPHPLPQVTIADKPIPYPGCPRDGTILEPSDFKLIGYEHHPFIKLPIAV